MHFSKGDLNEILMSGDMKLLEGAFDVFLPDSDSDPPLVVLEEKLFSSEEESLSDSLSSGYWSSILSRLVL